jgi:hypothetical protein
LVSDRIALGIEGPEPVLAAARVNRDFIATETLARTLELGQAISGADQRHAVDVEGHQVTFTVRRQNAD